MLVKIVLLVLILAGGQECSGASVFTGLDRIFKSNGNEALKSKNSSACSRIFCFNIFQDQLKDMESLFSLKVIIQPLSNFFSENLYVIDSSHTEPTTVDDLKTTTEKPKNEKKAFSVDKNDFYNPQNNYDILATNISEQFMHDPSVPIPQWDMSPKTKQNYFYQNDSTRGYAPNYNSSGNNNFAKVRYYSKQIDDVPTVFKIFKRSFKDDEDSKTVKRSKRSPNYHITHYNKLKEERNYHRDLRKTLRSLFSPNNTSFKREIKNTTYSNKQEMETTSGFDQIPFSFKRNINEFDKTKCSFCKNGNHDEIQTTTESDTETTDQSHEIFKRQVLIEAIPFGFSIEQTTDMSNEETTVEVDTPSVIEQTKRAKWPHSFLDKIFRRNAKKTTTTDASTQASESTIQPY